MKDTTALKLIAELELTIQKLEAGKGCKEVITSLENAIQAIMDEPDIKTTDWLSVGTSICYGGL